MSEPAFHFDDVQLDESISQINVREDMNDEDDEDLYGDPLSVPSVSTSVQTTQFKFPKSAGISAYFVLNDDNITEAMNLLKVFSPFILKLNLDTILTVCLQRAGFEGDRGEFWAEFQEAVHHTIGCPAVICVRRRKMQVHPWKYESKPSGILKRHLNACGPFRKSSILDLNLNIHL